MLVRLVCITTTLEKRNTSLSGGHGIECEGRWEEGVPLRSRNDPFFPLKNSLPLLLKPEFQLSHQRASFLITKKGNQRATFELEQSFENPWLSCHLSAVTFVGNTSFEAFLTLLCRSKGRMMSAAPRPVYTLANVIFTTVARWGERMTVVSLEGENVDARSDEGRFLSFSSRCGIFRWSASGRIAEEGIVQSLCELEAPQY